MLFSMEELYSSAMDKWEYKTVVESNWAFLDRKLNALGSEGWEAISLTHQPNPGSLVVVMKRQK